MDTILTLGGRRFGFGYTRFHVIVTQEGMELLTLPSWYMVIGFLLLDVTVSCEPINVFKATRQLLRCLSFNLRNLGLFGIKLKPGVIYTSQWSRAA